MFQKKAPKSEQQEKTPYTCYYPHDVAITNRVWNQGYMDWISIDPAVKKNLALRVERRHHNGKIETVVFAKCSFKETVVMNGTPVDMSYTNITKFLEQFKALYMNCHIFITERQMPINYKSNRVAQHVLSYFTTLLRNNSNLPMFYEIQASTKTKWLKSPKDLTPSTVKTWGCQKAYELLQWRGDSYAMQVMADNWQKQDDLADTVIQIEAVAIMLGYCATPEPINPVISPIFDYSSGPLVAVPNFAAGYDPHNNHLNPSPSSSVNPSNSYYSTYLAPGTQHPIAASSVSQPSSMFNIVHSSAAPVFSTAADQAPVNVQTPMQGHGSITGLFQLHPHIPAPGSFQTSKMFNN